MEETLVFIVQLWCAVEPQTSLRAAVLQAGTQKWMWFTQSEALATYFDQQVRAAAGTHGRVQPEEHRQ